jgi:hypothetical protein
VNGSEELLSGLNPEELSALADVRLASSAQCRLDELLNRNGKGKLSPQELAE